MTLLGTSTTPVSGQPGTYLLTLSSGLPTGQYTLSAVAIDNLGATAATSLPATILVSGPSSVSLTSPANNAVFCRFGSNRAHRHGELQLQHGQ